MEKVNTEVCQEPDQGAKSQAFGHVSRMYNTSASSFYTAYIAFLAYLVTLFIHFKKYIGFPFSWTWKGGYFLMAIIAPIFFLGFLLLRYYGASRDLNRISKEFNVYNYLWGHDEGLHSGKLLQVSWFEKC